MALHFHPDCNGSGCPTNPGLPGVQVCITDVNIGHTQTEPWLQEYFA